MYVSVQIFVWTWVFISLGWEYSSITAESHGKDMFNFIANCQTIYQNGCTILYSHEESMRELVAQHYFSHSDRCVVVSHYVFKLHSPNSLWFWTSFRVLICYPYLPFGKVVYSKLLPIFWLDCFLVLRLKSS